MVEPIEQCLYENVNCDHCKEEIEVNHLYLAVGNEWFCWRCVKDFAKVMSSIMREIED